MAKPILSMRERVIIGSVIWILAAQYFVIEYLALQAWGPTPYSFRFNTISDLGATSCGSVPTFACSALYPLMNLSFVLSSVITLAGMYFLRPVFPKNRTTQVGLLLIAIGSLGTIGVGVFPENENIVLHLLSAGTYFVLSNLGLIVLGLSLRRHGWHTGLSHTATALGVLGLCALALLPLTMPPMGGVGVMERIVAYPVTIWLVATGIFLLKRAGYTGDLCDPHPAPRASLKALS